MKNVIIFGVVAILLAGSAAAQMVRSGSVVLNMSEIEKLRTSGGVTQGLDGVNVNLIQNEGFEDGVLSPWTTNGWVVTNVNPNSGTYAAEAEGNIFIRQDFSPVDVTTVTSVTVFMLQPEAAISQICLFYDGAGEECAIFFPLSSWSQIDLVSLLRVSGDLTGIRVYGYSGGPTGPDITILDDVVIDSTIPVELQSLTVN